MTVAVVIDVPNVDDVIVMETDVVVVVLGIMVVVVVVLGCVDIMVVVVIDVARAM